MSAVAQVLATAPVPPQNLDAEESVLGAMMLSRLAIGAVTESSDLSAADFYRETTPHLQGGPRALPAGRAGRRDHRRRQARRERRARRGRRSGADPRARDARAGPSNAATTHGSCSEMATLRGLTASATDPRLGWDRPGETPELVDRAEPIVFDLAQPRVASSSSTSTTAPGRASSDHARSTNRAAR